MHKCRTCGKEVPRDGESKKSPVIASSGNVYCSLICYNKRTEEKDEENTKN